MGMGRKHIGLACCCVLAGAWIGVLPGSDDPRLILRRGDANNDYVVDGSDVVFISSYVNDDGTAPPCLNQADADDDGDVDTNDAVYLANWLYAGGPPPPAPGPFATECTKVEETKALGCEHPHEICE